MTKTWRFRRTTVITVGLLAFLGGLGFARAQVIIGVEIIFLSALVCAVTAMRRRVPALLSILILGFVLGWWRGQVFLQRLEPLQQLQGQHIVATVQATTDAVYDDRSQLLFDASDIQVSDPFETALPGVMQVAGFGEPAVYKGDILRIEGKVYASRGSRALRMSFAELKVLGRTDSPIDDMRRRFVAGMQTALPEPQASFGLGLLIGQRNTLPDEVTAQLSAVGLTHIIAVSGYNLTIIMRAVRRKLKDRSKYQITMISVVLMGLFLLMTGFSASIVRAAIVSGLSLLAWYYGRTFKPLLLLAVTAALTAGWNPLYIWSDIGWYLSFLAFAGVLIVAPLIYKRLFGNKEVKVLTGTLVETLCALLMTVPLVLYIFNQISLVAIISNLLIVPLVPFAMLFALVAGLAGMALPLLSAAFAFPARILLTYILDVAQIISRVPNALVERRLTLPAMLFMYGCIISCVIILWRQLLRKYGTITDKNILD